jgi:hypothetical protein
MKAFSWLDLWRSSTYKLCISTPASFAGLSSLVVTRRAWCYIEELVYERWIFGCCSYNGFSEFKELLKVSSKWCDVKISFFFCQESSKEKKRFKHFLWSFSVSTSRTLRHIIILRHPFKQQQFASSQEGLLFDHYILFTITFIVL